MFATDPATRARDNCDFAVEQHQKEPPFELIRRTCPEPESLVNPKRGLGAAAWRSSGTWGTTDAAAMPKTLRLLNILAAAVSLASGLAVLYANLFDPAYRVHYRDALWFVFLYVAFYAVVLWAFVTPSRVRLAQALAVVKALGAYLFLFGFPAVGQTWMAWTPGRYVYQLFDWGPEARIVTMAFVCLGRGAWNTVNAFVLTRDYWVPLRTSRPILGRLVTMVPVALTVMFVWMFLALARMNAEDFSVEAHHVARMVLADVDCEQLRTRQGTTTSDLRQRDDRRYEVSVAWDCRDLRVIVKDPDGKLGTARDARPECCPTR